MIYGFPQLSCKEFACNTGASDSWVGKIHWRRDRLPTSVFWPGEFHGLCIVHGVAKSWTRLSHFHYTICTTNDLDEVI